MGEEETPGFTEDTLVYEGDQRVGLWTEGGLRVSPTFGKGQTQNHWGTLGPEGGG